MPPISVLMKPSSGMCNMTCEYCFYCDETKKREQESFGFMSEGTLKNVIRKTMLQAGGMISYAFQGGEPTLRGLPFFEKAVEYQKQYNRNGIRVQNALQTNGLLLDESWCQFLKDNHFLVGVSLDGSREVHDTYRHLRSAAKEGTFERIVKNIELLERFHVDFNVLTVVHKKVAQQVEEIYRFYEKKGWHYQQYIACLDPLDEEHGKNGFSLTPEEYGRFLITLFELWYQDWKKGKQPYIRQFENYVGILLGYPPEACDQRGCCGIQYVAEADGSVYPCDFYMLDSYRLGNLNEERLDTLDEKRREIGFVERSRNLDPACKGCRYFALCRGGCQRNRDFDPAAGVYRNYFCESYRMFFEACEEKLKEMAEQLKGIGS